MKIIFTQKINKITVYNILHAVSMPLLNFWSSYYVITFTRSKSMGKLKGIDIKVIFTHKINKTNMYNIRKFQDHC